MSNPVFLLCPGQGAQAVGMAQAWCETYPEAQAVFDQADASLGYSLSKLCFEGPAEELNRTDQAQPALFTAAVACHAAMKAKQGLGEAVAMAGLSLGEFTALHLAGAFSFEDGLKLVSLRGRAMQDAAEASASSMVALTGGVEEELVVSLCQQAVEGLEGAVLVPANFNSSMQVVVSGSVEACEKVVPLATEAGLKATPLSVAGAFHSPIMAPAADRLAQALQAVAWSAPRVPVYSNVTGEPHTADPALIAEKLVDQLTHPVRWSQSMQHAAQAYPSAGFTELAPGKVLTGLMRRIDKSIKVTPCDQPPA